MADALIWGASGGIGGALVRELAGQGWRVFAAARDESRVPPEAYWRGAFDARNDASFDAVAYAVGTQTTELDLVVYAAGAMRPVPLDETSSAAWAEIQAVNLWGALRAVQVTRPLVSTRATFAALGAQVNRILLPQFGAYAASKAGLEAAFAIFAKEQRAHTFIVVRPGAVDTPFWATVPFRLPSGAQSPDAVAARILQQVTSGQSGAFDI
jgi:NAD(P)-dependent dehydrogenase (short-subunit alcohol dehydrogenase family)